MNLSDLMNSIGETVRVRTTRPAELNVEDLRALLGPFPEAYVPDEDGLKCVHDAIDEAKAARARAAKAQGEAEQTRAEIVEAQRRQDEDLTSTRRERSQLTASLQDAEARQEELDLQARAAERRALAAATEFFKAEEPRVAAFRERLEDYRRRIDETILALAKLRDGELAALDRKDLNQTYEFPGVATYVAKELLAAGIRPRENS